jgi:hypothetical protein
MVNFRVMIIVRICARDRTRLKISELMARAWISTRLRLEL